MRGVMASDELNELFCQRPEYPGSTLTRADSHRAALTENPLEEAE